MLSSFCRLALSRRAAVNLGATVRRQARPTLVARAVAGRSLAIHTFSTVSKVSVSHPDMFCRQCEQTKDHYACTSIGVCGKTSETAAIQDTLMEQVRAVSCWATAARKSGVDDAALAPANVWTLQATFSTLTNVNFDDDRLAEYVRQGQALQQELAALVQSKGGSPPNEAVASLNLADMTETQLEEFGHTVSVPIRQAAMGNDDCFSLNEIATYGLKGVCAYAAHVYALGTLDDAVMTNIHECFAKTASSEPDMDGLLATVLKVGETNGRVLQLLDACHAENFGNPEPSPVRTTAVQGKAILVSGHDLADLYALLQQTEGNGINVYTHGEMLPAHAYPKLKQFDHLVGNYGTAWQNQKFEFAGFPGPIVVTTNCILEPRKVYRDRLYSMNEVGVSGVKHVKNRDFSDVIQKALHEKGFERTIEPAQYITTGFNHRAVLPLADQVLEAVSKGQLSRIFLIGGCDGSQWDRNYFTDLAEATPDDSLILTLGCAKNRLIHSETLMDAKLANGLPRVLDMGQCNDSYSAIVVATELAKALDCSVNDLPLSLALSHLEQKAAAVLLTLLSMGVKNIRLGPSLPSYVTPNVLAVLQKEYNLMGTGHAQEDLAAMMEGK